MSDYNKVVKGLERHLDGDSECTGCPYLDEEPACRESLFRDALAVIKEQQEVKQIIRRQAKQEHSDGSIDYFAEWFCPHCNLLLTRGFATPQIKYCYKCGKAVKWDA